MDLISVIIPTYNRENKIIDAVRSVLEQTYINIEVIVIDDGSTDDTYLMLDKIEDKRLKYVYQENSGACVARNRGIKEAKGKYIAFHDSDDIWHKDKLEKQIRVLEKTNADIVFCQLLRKKNGHIIEILPNHCDEGFITNKTNLFGIGTQTIIGEAEFFKQTPFDINMPRFQELELIIRAIMDNKKIYCLKEGLVDYYVGQDSISNNPQKLMDAYLRIQNKHEEYMKNNLLMKKNFGNLLWLAGIELTEQNEDATNFFQVAYRCNKSYRTWLTAKIKSRKIISFLSKIRTAKKNYSRSKYGVQQVFLRIK